MVKTCGKPEADVAALRAILRERLEGAFVSAEEMRARTEALIARKRQDGAGRGEGAGACPGADRRRERRARS